MTTRRPTIRDVAAAAGVSISTVSLYMQGDGRVADETALRIATAIEQLHYTPRRRGPNASQASRFGMLTEDLALTAFPEAIYGAIIHGIESQAKLLGYGMMVATVEADVMPAMIADEQVAGVIILGGCPANDALAFQLHRDNFPVVLVDNYLAESTQSIEAIVPDNEWGGYNAFKHLLELGHKHIGIICGPEKYRTLQDRMWGALRAANVYNHPIRPEYIQPSISSGYPKKGYCEMHKLLALPEPPSAVFAVSDRTAFGALEAIREAGLSVPGDISLVGFDDVTHAEYALPPLTTVHYARNQLGALALIKLAGLIDGHDGLKVRTLIPTELIVRASTAPYQAPSPRST